MEDSVGQEVCAVLGIGDNIKGLLATPSHVDAIISYDPSPRSTCILSYPISCQSITLHMNLGDIKCEVFCNQVPRTAENFLALCASGYYDGTVFHRNIKGFMVAHYAGANSGPNANGSRFFITYAKQPF
ncbi:Peptidyl-prolyl cis-trans isomerase CYP18-1 [Zea mays]|uniref:Peptidyl-prolyl cis-trans isomerase CYP18-1 n=1 Tax=Zea mays TaxID=4577 RepID=A0A3L6DRD8_MAIZE|nr:Peptidyl-prolyl cis-trans isomerase CYP18-1 [Zea mays]